MANLLLLLLLLLLSTFSFSQGWPQRIIILHIFLSSMSVSFTPTSFISSFTTSKNLLFVLPLLLFPCNSISIIFISTYSWSLLMTCPYHLSLPSLIFIPKRSFTPSPLSLSHFFFYQLRCKIFCIHLQCFLVYSLSTLFLVGTICLHSFAPSYLPALLPFQSSFQYLWYPPL